MFWIFTDLWISYCTFDSNTHDFVVNRSNILHVFVRKKRSCDRLTVFIYLLFSFVVIIRPSIFILFLLLAPTLSASKPFWFFGAKLSSELKKEYTHTSKQWLHQNRWENINTIAKCPTRAHIFWENYWNLTCGLHGFSRMQPCKYKWFSFLLFFRLLIEHTHAHNREQKTSQLFPNVY